MTRLRLLVGTSGLVMALFAPTVSAQAPGGPAAGPGAGAGKPAPGPGAAPATADAVPAGAAKAPAPAAAAKPPAPGPGTPPPAAKPAPELDSLKVFLGKWKCTGKQLASAFGPEHAVTGTAEVALITDNFWQSFKYEEKKTKEHPGLKVLGVWGFDQGSKRFVRAAGGTDGWDTASATGWEGDKLTWTGELSRATGRMPFHQTFTKQGDKAWTHALEVRGPDGKWAAFEEVTCKK
jgi:hypothetical protein